MQNVEISPAANGRGAIREKKSSKRGRCCEDSDRFGSARSNEFRLFEQF
jgi:hypothetical protein